MNVKELIQHLQTLPQDAEVYISECGGCSECNPEAMSIYHEVTEPSYNTEVYVNGYRKPPKKVVII